MIFLKANEWQHSLDCVSPVLLTFISGIPLLLFSHQVVSDSLHPHEMQHSRLLCPSLSLGIAQTHVHLVSDSIQPFHPHSLSSPFTFNLSLHQGLFQWNTLIRYIKMISQIFKALS